MVKLPLKNCYGSWNADVEVDRRRQLNFSNVPCFNHGVDGSAPSDYVPSRKVTVACSTNRDLPTPGSEREDQTTMAFAGGRDRGGKRAGAFFVS
jgi:hypothetical protein